MPDWNRIDFAHAVPPGDRRYVPRPQGGGDRLATLVRTGLVPIAVTGPTGAGKTTELNQALALLGEERPCLYVAVDRLVDVERIDPDALVFEVVQDVVDRVVVSRPDFEPTQSLVDTLRASDPRFPRGHGRRLRPLELAAVAFREIGRSLGRPVLALDGLDRAPLAQARTGARALAELRDDADVIVVVPPALANGIESHDVLTRLRLFFVPALPVRDEPGLKRRTGERFLRDLLGTQLGEGTRSRVIQTAIAASGGVPRTFLQLVQDAARYAQVAGRPGPDARALSDAIADRADAMRRLLLAGDLDALLDARGTSGLDVPADRRVRFLSHDLLLEYDRGDGLTVHPHPLLGPLLERHERARGR